MRILITSPSLDETENVSGISSVVKQLIESGGMEFFHFAAGRRDVQRIGPRWLIEQLLLIPRFLLMIERIRPDIIHLNTAMSPMAIWRDCALAKAANIVKTPLLLHIHGGKLLSKDIDNKLTRRIVEKMVRYGDVVVVLSAIEQELIENRWPDLKVRVLPGAVALHNLNKKPAEIRTIIFLGRLHEGKGLNEIIEASRILRRDEFEFSFRCFGAGDGKERFIEAMNDILGDDFYYGGVVSGNQKFQELADSDIFLLPSHYEGLPVALLEAMAAGCVPVVSGVGSISQVVEDGFNGFLTQPGDVGRIVEKLKQLLSNDASREILQENAKRTIREKFTLDKQIEKLKEIYSEIAN